MGTILPKSAIQGSSQFSQYLGEGVSGVCLFACLFVCLFLTVIKYTFIYFVESEGRKKIIAKVDIRQTERYFRSPVTLEFI